MPILINSATFTDVFGNSTGFYKGNPVDEFTVTYNVSSLIRMTSIGNPLSLDPSLNQVLSPNASWIEEGFRVGDPVLIRIHSSGGGILYSFNSTIAYVDDVMCDFGAMPYWYNVANNEFVTMICLNPFAPSNVKARADLDVLFNHVKNSNPGSVFSLIDAEATRAVMTGIESMSVGQVINATMVGNQSGQFVKSVSIRRNAQLPDLFFNHDIIVTFQHSGMYDQSWFFSSEALKAYMKLEWAAVSGEPFARAVGEYTYEANTGWFNDAHNTSINNSTLLQGVSEIDYCVPSTFDIIVEGPIADLGIGAAYRSTDAAYYKNRLFPQQEICMVVHTQPATPGTLNSEFNEFGAGYDLTINSVTSVVNTHTINVTITPNAAFNTFISNVEDGDRLFYLWVKCGNINHLAFGSQLECAPPVGGPLIMVQDYGYLDHSQNVDSVSGNQTGFIADTEDDVAYIGTFRLTKNQIYESFSVKIEAFNTVSEDDFTLQQVTFSFASVPISGDGRYLLNETANITTELPNTSLKLQAFLVLEPSLDTATEYGVKIYAPWILNWRYWLPLLGASVDFYPNQNKNWEQYDNVGDWIVRTELVLIEDGLAFTHDNQIEILPYDAEDEIDSSIEILLEPSLTVVNVVPESSLMRIRSTHIKTTGAWEQSLVWGMITIEPTEQSPRWICSSVVDFDNNTSNPLTPLSGLLINIQFPAPDTAVLECYFDTNKIDLTNGVDITAKIKENDRDIEGFLITETKQYTRSFSVMKTASDLVYSGPLMTIRRQSDNNELDVNAVFDGTNWIVDVNAMLAFVGDGITANAWVVRWYDQSATSPLPATQIALNSQPQIVRNGAVIIDPDNGLPALDFDGVDDFFDMPSLGSTGQILHAMQYRRSQGTISPLEFSIGAAEGNNNLPYCMMHVFGRYLLDGIYNSGGIGNVHLADTTPVIDSFLNVMWRRIIDNDIYMNLNGVPLATINGADNLPLPYSKIGDVGFPGWIHQGLMQELNMADGGFDEVFTEGNMNFRYQTF